MVKYPRRSRAIPVFRWLCALGPIVCAGLLTRLYAATANIDTNTVHQTIRGFGGATVFQPPGLPASLSDSEMDTIFGNGPGQLGFNILRIRVAADDAWRAIELSHAQRAKARGAIVIATPWSPPAAMKSNNSLIDGFLLPENYAAYATYLNDFASYMTANGAGLHAISVQNEPDIDVTYDSCDWTPAQMLDFCRIHAGRITATRLIAPESFQFRKNISDPILNDPVAVENVEIIGGHIYGGGLVDYPLARAKDKEVWMTEHLDSTVDPVGSQNVPWSNTLAVGKEIHDCLATANFNAYIWWYLKRYYGPLGEDSVVTKRGYIMAQFSKFIRPGYVRIGATANPNTTVYVSAFKKDKLVIVVVNQGTSPVEQDFSVAGASVNSVTPWRTTQTVNMEEQPSIAVSGGAFSATVPAQSVTTFVGDLVFAAPTVDRPPQNRTFATGSTVTLDAAVSGEQVAYQWNRDGSPVPGETSRVLTITNAQAAHSGSYTVTATNSGGSVTSSAATVAIVNSSSPGRLVNISTRSAVGTGDNVQIAGFFIAGSSPKQVLIRVAGPSLSSVDPNLTGLLADPSFELISQSNGQLVASNNDWDSALAAEFAAAGAFAWTPGSKDAALLVTLNPGGYTAVVRGAGGGSGIGLVEVYDRDAYNPNSLLVNISTRSLSNAGGGVQIGGFYIAGETAKSVVIRASGPALNATFALNGVLADPIIDLYDQSTGLVVATLDDWEVAAAGDFNAVGAFPWLTGTRDAAIVTSLNPGGYTAIVRGKSDGTGMALVEIYGRN